MAGAEVKLLGYWASPYSLSVKWALKLKGIQYQYLEEDIQNKSPLLLRYNPVYKKVPVLVHNTKPLAESLVIVEYIDEVWQTIPLFPKDPYERAKARFWAKFAHEKQGEEQEKAAAEAREHLKTLESGLEGKKFFGGETIGYVDITAGWIAIWAPITEDIAGVNLVDGETMPLLKAWFKNVLEVPTIKSCLPPLDDLHEFIKALHKTLTAGSA
ncbi:glutathione transferase GST 23-like isoform X2 [Tripterygium wilfordii]|uniref:glutathione transferase GST 23-like isoform X2 n=1 Tax=Tripterygium wilfordii TaxID=458696 RepID=UPI0018F7FBCE|nr:glutathione transferase GST 23-like isoform X2 [Tripterygium wilfordii]